MSNPICKDGFPFVFNPDKCLDCKGKCCYDSKPSYLWIDELEINEISQFLKKSKEDFIFEYLRTENGLFNIKDIKSGGLYYCVFFDPETHRCSIYKVRPKQCRDFPFWECYKKYFPTPPECPGILKS